MERKHGLAVGDQSSNPRSTLSLLGNLVESLPSLSLSFLFCNSEKWVKIPTLLFLSFILVPF